MPEAAIVALLIAFPLVGAIARRWLALLLPIVGWPLFYFGLNRGWWGDGTGDGWQLAAAMLTVAGVGSTAVVIAIARAHRSVGVYRPPVH
jgi:hypothetical protein